MYNVQCALTISYSLLGRVSVGPIHNSDCIIQETRESNIIQEEAAAGVFGDGTLSFLLISPSTEHTNLSRQDNPKRGLQGADTVMVFGVGTMEGT